MKKNIIGVLLMVIMLSACSVSEEVKEKTDSVKPNDTAIAETENGIGVDKGLLNVEVTIPASFLEEEELEEAALQEKEDGNKVSTVNPDGSITYKMTKSQHKEMMKEMKANLNEYVDELIADETFASIHDITYNKDFSTYKLAVDQEAFENGFDGFAVLGLGMSGMFYQLYDGVNPEKLNVRIDTVNESTGELIGTVNYPEDLEGME